MCSIKGKKSYLKDEIKSQKSQQLDSGHCKEKAQEDICAVTKRKAFGDRREGA